MKRWIAWILLFSLFCAAIPAQAADYETHWAAGAILRAFSAGIISGDTTGDFYPDRNITRAEFVTLVAKRLRLEPPQSSAGFLDVTEEDWFSEYISAAAAQGIITGFPDNTFRPQAEISRQDAVVLLCRAFALEPTFSASLLRFLDFTDVSSYAQESLAFSVSRGLLAGYNDGLLRPQDPLTRAEALVLCEKFYTYSTGLPEKTVDFLYGYPKLSSTGQENQINLIVRTNQPCTVYAMTVNLETGSSVFTPAKEMIDTLLVPVERANVEYHCGIAAEPNTKYNIFLLAVASDGSSGKIHALKNVTALPYTAGRGTRENPYRIYTAFQLDQIRNFPKLHFRLEADIALTDPWEPIGSAQIQEDMFSGTLDGNGHKISNLQVSRDSRYAGLFAYIAGGTVKNLSVDANIQSESDAGGIAGHLEGGLIENCTVTGLIASESTNAGGIAGTNAGEIRNCLSAVYVAEATSYAGGIAGRNAGDIQNCLSAVHAVTADMYAGSIAGANFGGQISGCVAANMRTTDVLTANSGRITTNRYGGESLQNFGYDRMISNTNVSPETDGSQDGTDVSWTRLLQADFYRELGWDFDTVWQMPQKQTDAFLLPVLRGQPTPDLEPGRTMYAPARVRTAEDLQLLNTHPDYHFLLANDIRLPQTAWTPLCPGNGFTGSFDGNGCQISGLYIPHAKDLDTAGLFAVIGGGTVRNLMLDNVQITATHLAGGFAGENYGYIENCRINGALRLYQSSDSISGGGICGINAGTLDQTESAMTIYISGTAATAGGIAAQNEGFIHSAAFTGDIQTAAKDTSKMLLGGIAGMNADGFIYNAYANVSIRSDANTGYLGGICGLQAQGELYKCSAKGRLYSTADAGAGSAAYLGGIAGMAEAGLIMHSFSTQDLSAIGDTLYIGGICGFSAAATIQNTYAAGTVSATSLVPDAAEAPLAYAGGIAGYNESGFINGSVALEARISTNGAYGKICAYTPAGQVSDIFAYAGMICGGRRFPAAEDGRQLDGATLRTNEFYFTPAGQNGALGWSSVRYDGPEGVWTMEVPGRADYSLPLLNGVPYQNTFVMPALK